RLLETIRAYALEKLAESGETEQIARRHAAFFRDLLEAPPAPGQPEASAEDVARRVREIDNIRAALDWASSESGDTAIGVAITAACGPGWVHLSLMTECRERAPWAVSHPKASPERESPTRM